MEPSKDLRQMLAGNKFFVPTYQRAYSWDTEHEKNNMPKQVNVFLSDLEEYNKSFTKSPYYFGHFLFEQNPDRRFGVIDGQQRLTTIIIFLSALFKKLESIRALSDAEKKLKEDMIIQNQTHRFETVDYDKQLFKDYVIHQSKKDKNGLETESAKRIVNAFDFFNSRFDNKDDSYILQMLKTIENASCSKHTVKDESEAIQMFIFQNNRGKKPSNLEIIKAQFMFHVHLYGGDEKDSLIEEIKYRFEKIYKSISTIEYKIDEDDVLLYTLRVHFNSLWETNATEKINKLLSEEDPIAFVKSFTHSLAISFEQLTIFFGKDEKEQIAVHSLITLGGIGIALPFIIKAYSFGLSKNSINELCGALESIVLRQRLIGTRADITSRLNDVYQKFTAEDPSIEPILERIDWMKDIEGDNWWAYWNNEQLENNLAGAIPPVTAKFLLWKYENHLKGQGQKGYVPNRFDSIDSPELEHIAPKTPTTGEPIAAGYCAYDEEFLHQYIDCLGNYLLISKSHNCSVGNKAFADKRASYKHLAQQREIQEMTKDAVKWTKSEIDERHDKILIFLKDNI